jgi:hypothetical protein
MDTIPLNFLLCKLYIFFFGRHSNKIFAMNQLQLLVSLCDRWNATEFQHICELYVLFIL